MTKPAQKSCTKCVLKISDKKIVFKEKKSKVTFLNRKEQDVKKVNVDGDFIKDKERKCSGCFLKIQGKKCDGLLQHDKTNYYIELKGSDINHAIKQIINTHKKLNTRFNNLICRVIIVGTKVPADAGFDKAVKGLTKAERKLFRNHVLKSSTCNITLS